MNCKNPIKHTVSERDSLYMIAKSYDTSVQAILRMNGGKLNPYNLQIGSTILVCPGENYRNNVPQTWDNSRMQMSENFGYNDYEKNPEFETTNDYQNNMRSNDNRPNTYKEFGVNAEMRLAWEQHVYWTRMFLISVAERLKDLNATEKRLLQNPADIANIYGNYYREEVAQNIAGLLTEHLQIGGELITALRDNKTQAANALNRQWQANADKMAAYFSTINPYYNREDLRKMLYKHLDLTTQEVAMRLSGNYAADIQAFGKIEQEALMMADYFAAGIIKQFPQKFR